MQVTDSSFIVTAAQEAHLPQVARLHHAALPNDFLPSLGIEFLSRVYHPASFRSRHARTIVALKEDAVVGFVTIAHDTARFTSDVLYGRFPALLAYAVRASLRAPQVFRHSLEILLSIVFGRPDAVRAEIVLIAVDAAHRGSGIGKKLVAAALAHVDGNGLRRCRTKTLAANVGVIAMYEAMGWSVRERFRLIGREYVTIVSPPTDGALGQASEG